MEFIKKIINKILHIGIEDRDSEALQLKKISINMVPLIIGPVGFSWAMLYFFLGYPIPASFPLSYTLASVVLLFLFHKNKDINMMQKAQMTLILILPFFLMWSLGGFVQSSYIFIWAFFAPVIALIHEKNNSATKWLYSFIGFVTISAIMDPFLIENIHNELPLFAVEVFFILNISVALSGVYFLLNYFIGEKRKMRILNF